MQMQRPGELRDPKPPDPPAAAGLYGSLGNPCPDYRGRKKCDGRN